MNARQTKYVAGRLRGKSAREAYRLAGYKARGGVADAAAARLEAEPEIAEALGRGKATVVTAAISAASVSVAWVIGHLVREVEDPAAKPGARRAALKLIGDHLGAWTPAPTEPPCPINVDLLSDEAKRSLLTALRGASDK